MNRVLELKRKIEEQKEENIKLYKSIPLASKEDPLNKKADTILTLWREGSKIIKNMMKELEQLETTQKKQTQQDNNQVFVNGYGEATQRKISTSTYDKQQKRLAKDMLSFMGNR